MPEREDAAPPPTPQPSSPKFYASLGVALIALLVGLVGLYLWQLPTIAAYQSGLVSFVVMSVVALTFAVILFGTLHSYGKATGTTLGAEWTFGGPAALAVVVLLIGLTSDQGQSNPTFSLSVYFDPPLGVSTDELDGEIQLQLDRPVTYVVSDGFVELTQLDRKYADQFASFVLAIDGFQPATAPHAIELQPRRQLRVQVERAVAREEAPGPVQPAINEVSDEDAAARAAALAADAERARIDALIESKLDAMTTREKIGQLFIAGLPGGDDQDEAARRLIQDLHIGGIILYEHNFERMRDPSLPVDTPAMTDEIVRVTQSLHHLAAGTMHELPLFIAVDQEQGSGVVLEKGVTLFPSAMGMAATNDVQLVYDAGRVVGRELRALGVNFNLAPVLDINRDQEGDYMRDRSFGAGANWVASFGAAFADGLQREGVLVCGKHFPGHGQVSHDPHQQLPQLPWTADDLRESVKPFRHLVKAGGDAIMSAHIAFPNLGLERPDVPFSFSRRAISEHLRAALEYDGVVMADDVIAMRAAKDAANGDLPTAVVDAVKAGNDITLLGGVGQQYKVGVQTVEFPISDLESCISRLAVELDPVDLDRAVTRVLRLKAKLSPDLRAADLAPSRAEAQAIVLSDAHQRIAREVADRSISLIRDGDGQFEGDRAPLQRLASGAPLMLAVPIFRTDDMTPLFDDRYDVRSVMLRYGANVEIDMDAKLAELQQAFVDKQPKLVIFGVVNETHVDLLRGFMALDAVAASNTPIVVVSFRVPYLLSSTDLAPLTLLSAYSNLAVSNQALGRVLAGDVPVQRGGLPVSLGLIKPFQDLAAPQRADHAESRLED